jgi:hypothetical protein
LTVSQPSQFKLYKESNSFTHSSKMFPLRSRGIQQLITGLYEASNNSANPENAFSTVLPHLSSLESHLETCVKDVTVWVRVAKDSDPSSEKGIRAFLKKLKVAVDKSSFKEIERKIAGHKVRLGFSLSVLGMYVTNYIEVKVTSR